MQEGKVNDFSAVRSPLSTSSDTDQRPDEWPTSDLLKAAPRTPLFVVILNLYGSL